MKTSLPAGETARTATAVKVILGDLGYVLWLTRKLSAEIRAEKCLPIRPDMAEFCAVDIATCVA
jgi:hypothetical protein